MDWLYELAVLFDEWIATPIINAIFKALDWLFTGILHMVIEPLEWLLNKACITDLYSQMVKALTDLEFGLPALVYAISILNSLVTWEWIMLVLGCGLSATLGIIVFKIIAKLIPMIY